MTHEWWMMMMMMRRRRRRRGSVMEKTSDAVSSPCAVSYVSIRHELANSSLPVPFWERLSALSIDEIQTARSTTDLRMRELRNDVAPVAHSLKVLESLCDRSPQLGSRYRQLRGLPQIKVGTHQWYGCSHVAQAVYLSGFNEPLFAPLSSSASRSQATEHEERRYVLGETLKSLDLNLELMHFLLFIPGQCICK